MKDRRASVVDTESDVDREVAKLGPSTVFGEMSLLTGARRSATVVAETTSSASGSRSRPFSV